MNPVSPLPAITCLLVAVATSFLLLRRFGVPHDQGRYASIDGLRGYLAFFVFLHHSCVWYFFLHTGQWKTPPSNLYNHLGQSSVLLFFMITGFLFFSKLIDGRTKAIDWGRLFVSRFLRLVPLYLFAMLLLFLAVAYLSNGILKVPILQLLNEVVRWLGFTILGMPNVNGMGYTFVIVAGVPWPLPYEWFFYFSLPLLALTVRVIPPFKYIAISLVSIAGLATCYSFWYSPFSPLIPLAFFSGIMTSLLIRLDLFRQFAARKISSFILLGCMAIAIAFSPSAYEPVPIFLMSVAFAFIACGNNVFGVLVSPASRNLGEMAYSIYLLHGIILFAFFKFILGVGSSRMLSPMAYWLLIVGITPVLVIVCFFTFRFIERPAMQRTTALTTWLRSCLILRSKDSQSRF